MFFSSSQRVTGRRRQPGSNQTPLDEEGRMRGDFAERLVREFEQQSAGWFWEADEHGRLRYISDKVARLLCAPGDSVIGLPLTTLFHTAEGEDAGGRTLAFHLSSRTAFSDLPVCSTRSPDHHWSISGRPILDRLGHPLGYIGHGSDLTEKRRAEAEITRLALFDALTGLANRQRMQLVLQQKLSQSAATYRPTTLFLMDLDRFKAVNDTLGHPAGDELLKQVASRLLQCVRDTAVVGRLGGDEFQIVMSNTDDRHAIAALADEIIQSLSQPYYIADTSVTIGCSIGIAIAPADGVDAETLVRNADLALYAAKAGGRGVHRFFADKMLAEARHRKRLEDDLRDALAQNQLNLVYQPIVGTLDRRIVGYEALLRWTHPELGPISPGVFIPIAEESGLIEPLGEWVLRRATEAAAGWPADVRIAVNVSPIQFANPELPALVMNAIARSGIACDRLELEITESVFLGDESGSAAMFARLKKLGVRLALDDFGTGYSSMSYLQKAPFDKIKIDQSFVRGAALEGSRNPAIIQAIVTLANALGMDTTAEGVEMLDEIDLIQSLGCSHIQGFAFGVPLPPEQVRAQLEQGGGVAQVVSRFKTRAMRYKVLRRARMELGGRTNDVIIRNISDGGALVEGLSLPGGWEETPVRIALQGMGMMGATVRWSADRRIGVRFDDHVGQDRLNQLVGGAGDGS